MPNSIFGKIPSVNELLERPELRGLVDKISHHAVVGEVRTFLDNMRDEIRTKTDDFQVPTTSELAERIATWITKEQRPRLVPAVNATGVLLHTGLGRAPVAAEAVDAMAAVAGHYATLEVDAETGARSQRVAAVEGVLCELTGAEAAAVVNNNAGATMLALAAVAADREVIVSRGQLIEIGGSYRLPDVMAASGARLREVGTTNKTHLHDYERAIDEHTAAIMRAHSSNFRIVGFTHQPRLSELVQLAHARGVAFIDDVGSGALLDLSAYGITDEPLVRDSVSAGADLVLFSGDKLLGGPQCGILVGKRAAIDQVLKHPLMRALRVDKTTLAALLATLLLYRDPERARQAVPLFSMLETSLDNLKLRAERLAPQLAATTAVATAHAESCEAQLGGGSVPAHELRSWGIVIQPQEQTLDQLAKRLRLGNPSVFCRVQHEKLILDLRTVFPRQDAELVRAFENFG
ncbi:MAG: L-seryl-tRNA(Sec) selenium transferase [Planctomycetota bacterium]